MSLTFPTWGPVAPLARRFGGRRLFVVGWHDRSRTRAFTLIEVMVVVVIITLLSAIAIPTMRRRLESNHARAGAENLAGLFRNARLNAMGRGAATVVRFESGQVVVREAVLGLTCGPVGSACATLPVNTCNGPVDRFVAGGNNRQVAAVDANQGGDLTVAMDYRTAGVAVASTGVDICFTPLGRTYVRSGANLAAMDAIPFVPLTGNARVQMTEGPGVGVGATRHVVMAPNGAARVVHQ